MALYRSGEDPFAWDPKKDKPKRHWFGRQRYHGKHRTMKERDRQDVTRIGEYLDIVSHRDPAA